jgi:hypothetical protein
MNVRVISGHHVVDKFMHQFHTFPNLIQNLVACTQLDKHVVGEIQASVRNWAA